MGMTAYLLTLAVFIPVSGWVADRLGARTVFAAAIGVFTFASILCGFSNSLWQFTAARVLQGIGGAMMVPVGRLVVLRVTEKKDLIRAMAYITWPGLVAPIVGPPVGGFITTYSSWRWIFFLNVPLGLIGIILATLWIVNEREDKPRPFDWLGFALAGTACTSFMYSLELLGRQTPEWSIVAVFLGYSLLAGWMAVRHMRRNEHPLIQFACLRAKTFAVSTWGGSIFRIAINASPFLLPLMFQVPFGLSPFQSGLLVLAHVRGQSEYEVGNHADFAEFRFPQSASDQRSNHRWLTLFVRDAVASNTEAVDCSGAVSARFVSIDAVYQPGYAGLRGHSQTVDELGDQFFSSCDADGDGHGRGRGRSGVARRGVDARPDGCHTGSDGFSDRVCTGVGAGSGGRGGLFHLGSARRRGGKRTPAGTQSGGMPGRS